jgi:hypothetical protein
LIDCETSLYVSLIEFPTFCTDDGTSYDDTGVFGGAGCCIFMIVIYNTHIEQFYPSYGN